MLINYSSNLYSQLSEFAFYIQQNLLYLEKNCSYYQLNMRQRFSGQTHTCHLCQINSQYPVYWLAHDIHHYVAIKIQDLTNEGWQIYYFSQSDKSISEIWKQIAYQYENLHLEEIPANLEKFHFLTLSKKDSLTKLHEQLGFIDSHDEQLIFDTIIQFQNHEATPVFEIKQFSGKLNSYDIFLDSLNIISNNLQKISELPFPLWPENIDDHDYVVKSFCIKNKCSLLDAYHYLFCGKNDYQWQNGLLVNPVKNLYYNSKISDMALSDIDAGYFSLDNFHPYLKNNLLLSWPDNVHEKWNQAKQSYLELLYNAFEYFKNQINEHDINNQKLKFIDSLIHHNNVSNVLIKENKIKVIKPSFH